MQKLKTLLLDEWLELPAEAGYADAELAGILCTMGRKEQGDQVQFVSRRLTVFRRIKKLWGQTSWSPSCELASFLKIPPHLKGQIQIQIPLALFKTIEQAGQVPLSAPSNWAWLRGSWGVGGSLFLPKSGYYLVFRQNPSARTLSTRVRKSLQHLGITNIGERDRLGGHEILVREQDAIVTLLASMGMVRSTLVL